MTSNENPITSCRSQITPGLPYPPAHLPNINQKEPKELHETGFQENWIEVDNAIATFASGELG